MGAHQTYDVVVVGAGVFGAWTAWHLAQRGQKVLVLDAYGPANARASSGGESRIIRMGYGADELYTRWSVSSLAKWKQFCSATGEGLFQQTGVLWLGPEGDARLSQTMIALERCRVPFDRFNRRELENKYPQFNLDELSAGLLEPGSGVLMARRAVAAVLQDALKHGAEYRVAEILRTPKNTAAATLDTVKTSAGEQFAARTFVFACGAWLGKMFPDELGSRIFPSRQEVFFFGPPPGDTQFSSPALPTWLIQSDEVYGMPDLENRGFKIALDQHGPLTDPDTQSRVVSSHSIEQARSYVARRFPLLRYAPIVETRVCQYENTSNGDFLIDRHPRMENVWLAGGGSGHGFKHGPAFGEYLAVQILDSAPPEPRFSLSSKGTAQNRAVY